MSNRRKRKAPKSNKQKIIDKILNPNGFHLNREETIHDNFIDFVLNYNKPDYKSILFDLLKSKLIRKHVAAFHYDIKDICKVPIFKSIKGSKIIDTYETYIKHKYVEINKFIEFNEIFEQLFWHEKYEEANDCLENCKNELGGTLWYLRNKIILLDAKKDIKNLRAFYNKYKEIMDENIFRSFVEPYHAMAESQDLTIDINKIVLNSIKEMSEGKAYEQTSILSLLYLPDPLYNSIKKLECIFAIQQFSIFDQYMLISKLFFDVACKNISYGNEIFTDHTTATTLKFLQNISTYIKDRRLNSFIDYNNNDTPYKQSSIGEKIVNHYTEGDYDSVLNEFRTSFYKIDRPHAYINIISKAQAYLGKNNIQGIPKNISNLIGYFTDIYLLNGNSTQSIKQIKSSIIKHWSLDGTKNILTALTKTTPFSFDHKTIKYANNLTISIEPEFTELTSTLCNTTFCNLAYNTADDISKPDYRILKEKINENNPTLNIDELIKKYRAISILKKDFLEVVSCYYLKNSKYASLINLSSEHLIQSPESCLCLPMEDIVNHIESEDIVNLDAIIIVFYYTRYISNKKEYLLNEMFEEYLLSVTNSSPIEHLSSIETLSNKELVFFYDICIPDIMDYLGCFSNSKELKSERLKIINLLLERGLVDKNEISAEVDRIISDIIIDLGAVQIDQRKIFVDTEAIKRTISSDIESLFKSFKTSDEDKNNNYPASISEDKDSFAQRLYDTLLDQFLYNLNYGLDKNISTEIRHGFFSNFMRSKLKDKNIITELDEHGKYKDNKFWMESYHYVNLLLRQKINKILIDFTGDFNTLIIVAEEWMKVTINQELDDRAFNMNVTDKEYSEFFNQLDASSTPEECVDFLFCKFWDQIEACLKDMKNKLNVTLLNMLNTLFDKLISDITQAKSTAPLSEIMDAISAAKNAVREDIITTSSWFNRNESHEFSSHNLNDLIDISIRVFEQTFSSDTLIKNNISGNITLEGKHVKPLVISLINFYINSKKYGDKTENTVITVNAKVNDEHFSICINNAITKDKEQILLSGELDIITKKMKDSNSANLMRVEGGTGFCKSYKQLKNISNKYDINISAYKKTFEVRISYV